MIYFAEVSLTYMPTGPCGPSVPGFPAKPWENTKQFKSEKCGYYAITVWNLCCCGLTLFPGGPGGPGGPDFPIAPCEIHNNVNKVLNKHIYLDMKGEEEDTTWIDIVKFVWMNLNSSLCEKIDSHLLLVLTYRRTR